MVLRACPALVCRGAGVPTETHWARAPCMVPAAHTRLFMVVNVCLQAHTMNAYLTWH